MKVAFTIPTYADDHGQFRAKFIDRMIPSMERLADCGFSYLLNFQRYAPWQIDEVVHAMKVRLGWKTDIKWISSEYEPPVSMAKIREDTCQIDSADVYVCADDDMEFRRDAGARYAAVARYMERHRLCGAVMCNGYLGGAPFGKRIIKADLSKGQMWWTSRGLFLRRLPVRDWRFSHPAAYSCPGTFEETWAVYCRLEYGFFAARTYNVPVIHRATRADDPNEFRRTAKGRYPIDTDIHNPKFTGIIDLIKRRWSQPNYRYGSPVPEILRNQHEQRRRLALQ